MPFRALAFAAALLVLPACGSKKGATAAQEPLEPSTIGVEDPGPDVGGDYGPQPAMPEQPAETADDAAATSFGPPEWTGAFEKTAVMVARSFHIEGPAGLLDHVVASSDDALYDRSVELTPDGLMQVIERPSEDVREIRVQLDAWKLAALERVVILERATDGPVHIIADGEAIWRDTDGHLLQAQRLEFSGEIGDDTPFSPNATDGDGPDGDERDGDGQDEAPDADDENEGASTDDAGDAPEPDDAGAGV